MFGSRRGDSKSPAASAEGTAGARSHLGINRDLLTQALMPPRREEVGEAGGDVVSEWGEQSRRRGFRDGSPTAMNS